MNKTNLEQLLERVEHVTASYSSGPGLDGKKLVAIVCLQTEALREIADTWGEEYDILSDNPSYAKEAIARAEQIAGGFHNE